MTTLPNGRHDDQVDATAQFLDWFKPGGGPSSNAGIFELTRQRAEELRRAQMPGASVRLRAARRRPRPTVFRPPPRGSG